MANYKKQSEWFDSVKKIFNIFLFCIMNNMIG